MLEFARALPKLRTTATKHLALKGLPRERVLAGAVRLLDCGFFRIGGEDYAENNGTYGLATMRKDHVTLGEDGVVTFDYEAKGGKQHLQSIVDDDVYGLVRDLKRRRSGGDELLAYRAGRSYVDVRSPDINAYIKEHANGDFSAKDFRPGTRPCSRRWVSRCRAAQPRRRSLGPGRLPERSRRSRTTSGTPRQSAGPPTSTRGLRPLPRRGHDRRRDRRELGEEGRARRAGHAGPGRGGRPRSPSRSAKALQSSRRSPP